MNVGVIVEIMQRGSLTWVVLEAQAQEEKTFQLKTASFGEIVCAVANVESETFSRSPLEWQEPGE